jgi:ABC-type lipoprotein release transport system permease subunit
VAAGLLAGAWPVALVFRLLAGVLAGVTVHAPLALVLAVSAIAVAALCASLPPARRAAAADPVRLLRAE